MGGGLVRVLARARLVYGASILVCTSVTKGDTGTWKKIKKNGCYLDS